MMSLNNEMYNISTEGGDIHKIKKSLNLKVCLKRYF